MLTKIIIAIILFSAIGAFVNKLKLTKSKMKQSKLTKGGRLLFPKDIERNLRNNTEVTGCYIIHNMETDRYYVGQSSRVNHRLKQHFNGKGSPGVYKDYCAGFPFEIMIVSLNGSTFSNLDDQERTLIAAYNAYYEGYNKNRGNGGW